MALRTPAATPRLLDTIAAIWGFDPNEPFQEEDEDDVKREPSAETWNSTSTEKRDTYQEPPAATPPAAPPIFEGIEDISDAEEETPSLFKAGLDAAEDLDLDAPEPLAVDEEPSEPNAEDHSSGTIHEQPIPEPKAPSEEEYVIPLHERIKTNKRKAAKVAEDYIGGKRSRTSSPPPQKKKRKVKGKNVNKGDKVYEVNRIVSVYIEPKKGTREGKKWYLVAWKGYSESHDTWEPEEGLVNAQGKVAEFWERRNRAKQNFIMAGLAVLFTRKLKKRSRSGDRLPMRNWGSAHCEWTCQLYQAQDN